MRNLSEVAAGNAAAVKRQSKSLIDNDSSGRVGRFHRVAGESRLVTNVLPHKVLAFDFHDELLDARRLYVHYSGGDQVAGITEFERSQPAGRLRFEGMWEYGDRFLYGTANAGGPGAAGFGSICLVIADPQTPPPDALAVFPDDSVKRYAPADALDEALATAEAAPWEQRGDVAVIKLWSEVGKVPEVRWPHLLCNRGDYLEVVRAGSLPLRNLGEVRISPRQWDGWQELRTRMHNGDVLTADESPLVATLEALDRWRSDLGVPIHFEEMDEDALEA